MTNSSQETKNVSESALSQIGGTPLVRLQKIVPGSHASVFGKLEAASLGGSVKDRPAYNMLNVAEEQGLIQKGSTIVEATSGNTGISLAMISAIKGYRCVLVMPEDMSTARRLLLSIYGAEIVLSEPQGGMAAAVQRAEQIAQQTEGAFMPRQFDNPANPAAHEQTTGPEIWQSTSGKVDAFVAGVGTGGTISGVGRYLKKQSSSVLTVAVEPAQSAVLSGGKPGLHGIQGLGAGFVPGVYDSSVVDEVCTVTDLEAEKMTRRLAREEGLLVGPSSGANVHVALRIAERLGPGKTVVALLCDTGERYIC